MGIHRLEDYYSVKFFQRDGKNLTLTKAGKALYEIADQIFEIEMSADECILSFQKQEEKHIRIHASETFGAYYLPAFINRFNKSYPNAKVSLDIMLTDQVVENTFARKNDLGFISYAVENEKLWIREIFKDKLVIIVRPDHPYAKKKCIEPRDLEGQHVIRHEKSSAIRSALTKFAAENAIPIDASVEFSNNEAIKRAVAMEAGIALISQEVVREEIRRGELKAIPLSDSSIFRKFYIIRHKDKYISKLLQILLDRIKKWALEHTPRILHEP